ncbi:membrane hypothetical protein [Bradyrhizobium sp. STM 3843]|uniref:hypothetical protein n=1 Tax=Bradyrhizobium sp. STM 3843 TaxID=551947 RepID=UPI0002403DAA|nr:hypothetical protein [Bradyrhizobium sp. STM 3843]CCE12167.1 membrane hypothetical protein [Bradyrhizobium sp. STM 3843]
MRLVLLAVQIVVAGLSLANIIYFRLNNLLAPSQPEAATSGAVLAIVGLTIAAIGVSRKATAPRLPTILALLIVLTGTAGFVPRLTAVYEADVAARLRERDDQNAEQIMQSDLTRWSAEIDARLAEHRALSGDEAWALLDAVRESDLRYRGLANRQPEAIALLQKAMKGKVFDPNVMVQGKRPVDTAPRPLFLQFYKETIETGKRARAVRAADWQLMQVLAVGADLTRPEAAALAADLGRTVKPRAGDFITLD